MIDFYNESSDKQWLIEYDGGSFANSDIYSQSISITEGINSDRQLKFGSVESASISFTVANNGNALVGKELTVTLTCQDETMQIGKYKVSEERLSSNRDSKTIVAYDVLSDVFNMNVASWYNTVFGGASLTLKEFRNSFFAFLNIEETEIDLVNDDIVLSKTIQAETISGKTILNAICEINGCFGHINRQGKFEYVVLRRMSEGLYPRIGLVPKKGLYPKSSTVDKKVDRPYYISAQFEDFKTQLIDKIQIRQEPDDIGGIYGDGNNCYIIQNNFICYGMSTEALQNIGHKLLDIIGGIWYVPASVEAVGNFNINVGDGVKFETRNGTIMTYVLNRTIRGNQALRDKYVANGIEKQEEKVDSVNDSIIALSGKTNRLIRKVDELSSVISDAEGGLQSQITQNANAIRGIVTNSYSGNLFKEEMFGNRKVLYPGTDSGYGIYINGSQNPFEFWKFYINGSTDYTFCFYATSEDYIEPGGIGNIGCTVYRMSGGINIPMEIYLEQDRVSIDSTPTKFWATINLMQGEEIYIRFYSPFGYRFKMWDFVMSQGDIAQPWTPNRTDEIAQLNMTASQIDAKVEKNGGDESFSWELYSDGFSLKSQGIEVFKANAEGIVVNGYAKANELSAYMLSANYVNVGTGLIRTAMIENLDASKITSGRISTERLDASVITTGNISAQQITASQISGGTLTVNNIRIGGTATASGVTSAVGWNRITFLTGLNWKEVRVYNNPIGGGAGYVTGYLVTSVGSQSINVLGG